ncbi:Protein of unknown function [Pyronema omphalodes CBS 100304]|uniref:Uncharacterized protein n=1 Tax=Pyronema omphalodes (strain CBS 100304) TaxID=1076935 RepID=U4L184_PYROM|nr:Protein of unknown function [Pyronema omphalodes CBS 100304]
MPGRFSPQAR